ncbi:M20/M25/M40 family metallo-hydrolase [Brevibacillus centrosporus]|uniref:M20 metallopeptidase family protein n=1 Tax=Brevibacillus centrosporus TaxID=54910 RepID=UPI003D22A489
MEKKNLELAVQLRHELHQHPEVSNHEVWTKQHLIDFLKTHTRLEIVDRGKWFYAIYRAGEGKPNIAFRADFDALPMEEGIDLPHASMIPGVSHKCGHDGHSATLAGFALEVDQKGADKNIFFLFQHAEETGDGAAECAVFIEEHHIEEIFAYHNMSGMPHNSVNVIDGTAHCASKGMTIHMEGSPAHASQPETGKNPSFAIAKVIDAIPELISPKNNEEKGLTLVEMKEAFRGSEDYGHYTKLTKGAMCYIGNGEDYPHVHTYEYDFRDDIMETAVEVFKGLATM